MSDEYLPNVLHWAKSTHHRHTAGFYYGVPWRAAIKYAKGVFNGRGVPLPYKAVFYTALRNAFNIQSMPDAWVYEMMNHRFAITLLLQE